MPDRRRAKRTPGRPPISEDPTRPATRVVVLVEPVAYDRAHQTAREQGISVPELLRRGLSSVLAKAQ